MSSFPFCLPRPRFHRLGATSVFDLMAGDLVEIKLPGGGGWGDPLLRDISAIEADLEDGFISNEFAMKNYGYESTLKAE